MDYFKFLPLEIKLDILTRLPTESVLDSKSVCTNWRSVVAHPSFSRIHLNRHLNRPAAESGELGFLVLTRRRLHYFEYNQNHDQSANPIQRITRIIFTPPFKQFRFLGSINGLVCLVDNTYNRPRSVWICNPITRECLMLPEIKRDCDSDGYSYEETSFGYVSSTNEYKIVRFYKSGETHLEVHIYTLGSGKGWRNLGKFNYGSESLYLEHGVFFANETLYWLDDELEMIGTFDLAVEKFCQHLAPPPLPPDSNWILQYTNNLGVFDGFLFFALEDKVDGFNDIWVLKKKNHNPDKDEGEEHQSFGWKKEFRIDGMKSMDLFAVTKRGGVLTNSDDYINIYDTKTSTCKSLVEFKSYIAQVSPHKNTLVSLKELGEKDIKVMESAEIEETKSSEQLQEDADPEYIYL